MVAYWTRNCGVMGSNLLEVNFFVSCNRRVIVLYYTENCYNKIMYFLKIDCLASLFDPVVVALVSIRGHIFFHPYVGITGCR
jgi:hypothetical protein